MSRVACFLLLFTPLALAAPIPPSSEKERIEKLWGKIVSPGRCEFKLNGKALVIRTAGQPAGRAGLRTEKDPIPRELAGPSRETSR